MPRGVDCPQSLTPIVTVTTVPFSYPTAVPSEGTVVSPQDPLVYVE